MTVRQRHALAALVLVAVATLAGCGAPAPVQPSPKKPTPLVSVPDLRGKTLHDARRIMQSSDVSITVVFPAIKERYSAPATTSPTGILRPAHVAQWSVPQRTLLLGSLKGAGPDTGSHLVVAQSPAPGTAMSATRVLVLTAARHPNTIGIPWVEAHVIAVQRNGANSCLNECHETQECVACHTAQGR